MLTANCKLIVALPFQRRVLPQEALFAVLGIFQHSKSIFDARCKTSA
jgi:hypothetical protein